MGFITDVFDIGVQYNGHRIRTNAAYDNVLTVQKLYRDESLGDADKVHLALKLLLPHSFLLTKTDIRYQTGLLNAIFEQQIQIPERPHSQRSGKILDFDLDGEYIYASFYQDYGIDLIDQQGRLHWKKFLALFAGLSEDTKIKQVMQIRAMEIPAYDGKNGEWIARIIEQKSYYALPVSGGGGQNGLNALFGALEKLAT